VIATPANDLWAAIDGDGVETLIPAIREFVIEVEIEQGRVVVRDIPGWTADER
jgi:ribosomal 30S subunit maturation factor RimM